MISTQDDLDAAIERGATEVSITGDWPVLRLRNVSGVTIAGDAVVRWLRLDLCDGVTLNGFSVAPLATGDEEEDPLAEPVMFKDCDRLTVRDVNFSGPHGPGIVTTTGEPVHLPDMRLNKGPFLRKCTNSSLVGCVVEGFRLGITVRECDEFQISDCTMQGMGNDNFRLMGGNGIRIINNRFLRRSLVKRDPWHPDHGQSYQFRNGTIPNPTRVLIQGNLFWGGEDEEVDRTTQGFLAQDHAGDGNRGWEIRGNTFAGSFMNALMMKNAADCLIEGNRFFKFGPGEDVPKVKLPKAEGTLLRDNVLAAPFQSQDGVREEGNIVVRPEEYGDRLVMEGDPREWVVDGGAVPPLPEPDPEPEEPPQPDPKPEPTPDPDHAARLAALEDEGRADRVRISAVEGHLRQIVAYLRGTPQ